MHLSDVCDLYVIKGVGFICNNMIMAKYLWKDGIHLQDLGTNILSANFIEFVNNYLCTNFDAPLLTEQITSDKGF